MKVIYALTDEEIQEAIQDWFKKNHPERRGPVRDDQPLGFVVSLWTETETGKRTIVVTLNTEAQETPTTAVVKDLPPMQNKAKTLVFNIYKGGEFVREERLKQYVIKIGRLPSSHLYLDDDSVSRLHAVVEVVGGDVNVIDLGSIRGTFVNGQKVNKAKLTSGDQIGVGGIYAMKIDFFDELEADR